MAPRLGIININVTNLAVAASFYGDKLGLECRNPHGANGPLELYIEGGPIALLYPVAQLAGSSYEDQRVTLTFYTDDLENTIRRWRLNDVEFVPIKRSQDPSGIGTCPYGRFIAFKDPFGNVMELLEPHKSESQSQ